MRPFFVRAGVPDIELQVREKPAAPIAPQNMAHRCGRLSALAIARKLQPCCRR
jgi:hypothetical protein